MILQQYNLESPLADGWTINAVAFAGPDRVDQWQVVMAHCDGVYQVVQTRPDGGNPPIENQWYSGPSNKTATWMYLNAVGSMTREAQGIEPEIRTAG